MPDKSPERIRSMFDRIAPTYDRLNRLFTFRVDLRWRRRAVSQIAPGARVLDLCCGTGDLVAAELDRGLASIGIDFSETMLRRARAKLRSFPRARLVRADALRLPFADATFDACTVGWGLRNLVDLSRGLAEIRRILKPGGVVRILEFSRPVRGWSRLLYEGYVRRIMPAVGDLVSGSRAYRYLSESVEGWHDAEAFSSRLRESGFDQVEPVPLSGGLCHLFAARKGTGETRGKVVG
jgi:demethylmenaquinone methyltransferase/2-methoxy-6-polyprenyl-1,4-benzoquinol methylase